MKRSALTRSSAEPKAKARMSRSGSLGGGGRRSRAFALRAPAEDAERERWFDVVGPVCRLCGEDERLELHHVVERAWLKRHNLTHLLWSPANRLCLCTICHEAHTSGHRRIPFAALSAENLTFIEELRRLDPPVPIDGHLRRYAGFEEAA